MRRRTSGTRSKKHQWPPVYHISIYQYKQFLKKAKEVYLRIAFNKSYKSIMCIREREEANFRMSRALTLVSGPAIGTIRQMSLDSINTVRGVPERDVSRGPTLAGSEQFS